MKIYIMSDMEGASGIHCRPYCLPTERQYAEGRRLLTADVNAAVEGALQGGATTVYVSDTHGGRDHFIVEDLHPAAIVDHNSTNGWWGELDETFDAVFMTCAHAMAGTQNAFLDHTQNSMSVYNFRLNGRAVGELGQFACLAGHFNVPVTLVTGDRATCVEAAEFFPGCATAEVKWARSRDRAVCLSPARAHDLIREAAAKAVKLTKTVKPFRVQTPIEVIWEWYRTDMADENGSRPGVERIGPRETRYIAQTPLEILNR